MTRIISSQRMLDWEMVANKIQECEVNGFVEIIVIETDLTDDEGNNLHIMIDGHHRLEAAELTESDIHISYVKSPYNETGYALLDSAWIDSDWYDIKTKKIINFA